MTEDKIVAVVRETKDYSKFKDLVGNRPLYGRPDKIKKSIEDNGYIMNPIIVNEHFEKIDGQARFKALSSLKMPIHYIEVAGLGLPECITMNAKTTPWNTQDYIESYITQGNENYKRLKELYDGHLLGPNAVLKIAKGYYGGNGNKVGTDFIKSGDIIITEDEKIEADEILTYIDQFKPALSKIGGSFEYWGYALAFCYRCLSIDNKRLFAQVSQRAATMHPCAKVIEALKDLEVVYNFKNHGKVHIVAEYEDMCCARMTNYKERWLNKRKEGAK